MMPFTFVISKELVEYQNDTEPRTIVEFKFEYPYTYIRDPFSTLPPKPQYTFLVYVAGWNNNAEEMTPIELFEWCIAQRGWESSEDSIIRSILHEHSAEGIQATIDRLQRRIEELKKRQEVER